MERNKVSFLNPQTGEPLSLQEIDEMFMRRCLQWLRTVGRMRSLIRWWAPSS